MTSRCHVRKLLYCLLFLLFSLVKQNTVFAQANWNLPIDGRVEHTDEKKGKDVDLEGATVTLYRGSAVVTSVTTGSNGKFAFRLEPNNEYVISATKPGFIVKKFAVSTRNVPDERGSHGFGGYKIELVIFEQYPGLDYSVTNNPVAKIVYNPSKDVDDFDYDKAYTEQMRSALAKLEELARAAREKEKAYNAAMDKANKSFNSKDYTTAKAGYTEASGIKPNEQLPKDKIKECDDLINKAANGAKADNDYKAAIKTADAAFAAKSWDAAKAAYQTASGIKPDEAYPKNQLKAIDDAIAKDKAAKDLDAKYQASIKKGDDAMAAKTYDVAKAAYTDATGLKPSEAYPKAQLKAIDDLIAKDKAAKDLDAKYQAAIKKGDDAMAAKNYDVAKSGYTDATGLKPAEAYPKAQLKAIDDLIAKDKAAKDLDAKYQASIKKGDDAMAAKSYDAAKAAYTDASGLKPAEAYPKAQLKAIDDLLAKDKAAKDLDAKYQAAIKKGDDAMAAKAYDVAKAGYTEAAGLKPAEAYPKAQLKAIDDLLAKDKAAKDLDAKYQAAIKKGDDAMAAKTYDGAKAAYTEASSLKSTEAYPKQKLKEIEDLLAKSLAEKAAKDKYNAAIAKADVAFKAKKYDDAKAGYNEALGVMPDEAYPKAQLKAIDDLLAKDAAAKELNDKYNAAIAKADAAFKGKDYDGAKAGYNEALTIKSAEAYPKNQLKAIDDLLAKDKASKELNDKYQAALKKGDDAFAAKNYDNAKAGYTEASGLKPTEQYPKDKLKEIAAILAAAAKDKDTKAKYDAAIAKADKAMGAKDYPGAKASYSEALALKGDEQYPKDKLKELDDLMAKDANAKALNAKYQAAITKADGAFKQKDYKGAKASYTEASGIKPDEQYPKDKLKEIDDLLAKADADKAVNEKYNAALAKADQAFKAKKYDEAKTGYNEALGVKPDEAYPKNQLKAIDDLLAKDAASKELNEKYQAAIKKGDDAFAAKDYSNARSAYTDASGLKPTEVYPKNKIKEIDGILAKDSKDKETNEKYQAAIAKGDEAFNAKDYASAKTSYTTASGLKPTEQYPKDKLKAISDLLASSAKEKELNAKYNAAIAKGDAGFTGKQYAAAKAAYTEASGLKPYETYPKERIKAIDDLIAKEASDKANALEEKYKSAIAKGDAAMGTKDYPAAKAAFTEASGLKPTEQYPKDKLKAISDLMASSAKEKELNAKYNAAIAKGDAGFTGKQYAAAKAAYTEASGLKPDEAYPKERIKAIDDLIAKESADKANALEEKYKSAIASGDLAMGTKDYPTAKAAFTEASGLKPKEQYPKDKLKEISDILAKASKSKELDAKYNAAIAKADQAFNAKQYAAARTSYSEATGLKPDEQYPKDKLKAIEELMGKINSEKETNARYAAAIAKADGAYKTKNYVNAKAGYQEALGIKPEEEYPQARLKEIDELIAKENSMKDVNEKYNAIIAKADKSFGDKDYPSAKAAYQEALGVKPAETYPKTKLEQIETLMAKEEKDKEANAKYTKAIKDGDAAFVKPDLNAAKAAYTEASGLKPNEMYPKDKLREVEAALKAQAAKDAKDAKFKEAVAKADASFDAKEYATARTFYNSALTIRPEDPHCLARISEIDNIVQDAEVKKQREKKFADAMAKGDKAFGTKDYSSAKSAYLEAMGFKPNDPVVKQKVKDCDAQLNKTTVVKTDVQPTQSDADRKSALAQKYGPGVTELGEVQDGNSKVLTKVVVKGGDAWTYTQRTYSWGGVYYFKDGVSISKAIFDSETK